MSLGRQNSPRLRTTGLNGKRALPAITKNLFFFNPLSTCQCDSLFPANPTYHKWPISELLAPDYNVLSSNPKFPQTTHECPRYAAFCLPGQRLPSTPYRFPVPGSRSPWAPAGQKSILKVQVREKANLPVLQVGLNLPVSRPSSPNLSS